MTPVELTHELPAWARSGINAGAVLLGALIAHWLLRRAIFRFARRHAANGSRHPLEASARAHTLAVVLRNIATATLWVIAVLLALSQASIDIGPLMAAAGVVGVALGIGGQHVTRDLIAGVYIVLEDQYRVGDFIETNGVAGRVENVSLRSTAVRDVHGTSHVISNGDIRTSSNLTKGFSRYVIDLPVPYEEDVDRVIEVAQEEFEKMRSEPEYASIIRGPLHVLGVDAYEEKGLIAKVYVETEPGRQWDAGRELRRRIKRACDERGISIKVA